MTTVCSDGAAGARGLRAPRAAEGVLGTGSDLRLRGAACAVAATTDGFGGRFEREAVFFFACGTK